MTRVRALRLIAGYGAIASALPYLALKIVWLTGGSLGASSPALMREAGMIALNALTAGMDLVGIVLALAFTHQWGQRMPAWLLLPPMWVATGLLARFIIGVPIVVVAGAVAPGAVTAPAGGPVQPWVYAVVYTEFAGMGVGLIAGFFLYARGRWSEMLDVPAGAQSAPIHQLHVALANTTTVAAIALAAAALAATVDAATRRTLVGVVLNAIDVGMAVAAAAGMQMMVRRTGRSQVWALAMAWTGAGSLFSWGLWQSMIVMSQTALTRGAEVPPYVNVIGLVRLIVGLVMGLQLVFLLASQAQGHPRRGPES